MEAARSTAGMASSCGIELRRLAPRQYFPPSARSPVSSYRPPPATEPMRAVEGWPTPKCKRVGAVQRLSNHPVDPKESVLSRLRR